MTKETSRKCSHCGHNGHNSRTCKGCNSIRLFGVKISVSDDHQNHHHHHGGGGAHHHHHHDSIRRSKSMGSLQQALMAANNNNGDHAAAGDAGYLSDDHLIRSSAGRAARKKGTSWTEDEHRSFLIGLEKLGKGDWRGISRSYVPSRTPTQVASHAQKYFIRMSSSDKKKRRTSVFDLGLINKNQRNAPPQGIPSPSSSDHQAPPEVPKQASVTTPIAPPVNKDESKGKAIEYERDNKAFPVLNSAYERPLISPNLTCEKPPISPVSSPLVNCMPYMNMPVTTQMMPVMSWAPVVTYPHQSYVYLGNSHRNYAASGQYMSHQHASLLPPLAPAMKKDGLDLNIGALKL